MRAFLAAPLGAFTGGSGRFAFEVVRSAIALFRHLTTTPKTTNVPIEAIRYEHEVNAVNKRPSLCTLNLPTHTSY